MPLEQHHSPRTDRRRPQHSLFHIHGLRGRRRRYRRQEDAINAQLSLDWHPPHLFYLTLGIMLLSVADAHNTLQLLQLGAQEMNLLMDYLIRRDIDLFVTVKLAMTAVCLVVLVGYHHLSLFKRLKIRHILYSIFALYAGLISYEIAIWPGQGRVFLFLPAL